MDGKSQRLFISSQVVFLIIDQIFAIITSLFIWQKSSLAGMLAFQAFQCFSSIPFFFITAWALDRFSPTSILMLGLASAFVQAIVLIFFPAFILQHLLLYAFLTAISLTLIKLPLTFLTRKISITQEKGSIYGILNGFSQGVFMLFPVISAFLITYVGYQPLFILAVGCIVLVGVTISNIHIPATPNPFLPKRIFLPFNRFRRLHTATDIFWGMETGIVSPMLPIATIMILGSIQNWGIFTSALSLMAIVFSYFYSKKNTTSSAPTTITLFAFLIAGAGIFFTTAQTLSTFIIYMVILRLWQSVQATSINFVLDQALMKEENNENLQSELSLLSWIPFMLGKGVMILLLLPFVPYFHSTVAIGILFILTGFFVLQEQLVATLIKMKRDNTNDHSP